MSLEENVLQELDDWNPMAEAYHSKAFNTYDDSYSLPPEFDACCLHVRNIPSEFTREDFAKVMMQGGIKVKRVYLHPPKPDQQFVYGYVAYATRMDAQRIKDNLNGKPPFNFKIKYARKKRKDDNEAKLKSKIEKLRCILSTSEKSEDFTLKNRIYNTLPSHASAKIEDCKAMKTSSNNHPVPSNASAKMEDCKAMKTSSSNCPLLSPLHKGDCNADKKCNNTSLPKLIKDLNSTRKENYNPVFVKCGQNGRKVVQERTQRNNFNSRNVASYPFRPPGLIKNPFFWCLFCNAAVGKFSCAVCSKPYCSSLCQEKDWERHKLTCRPL